MIIVGKDEKWPTEMRVNHYIGAAEEHRKTVHSLVARAIIEQRQACGVNPTHVLMRPVLRSVIAQENGVTYEGITDAAEPTFLGLKVRWVINGPQLEILPSIEK